MNGNQGNLMFGDALAAKAITGIETKEIPVGLCQCGCGRETRISKQTRTGAAKGQPQWFLLGHHASHPEGSLHPNWRGGRVVAGGGYIRLTLPAHPYADKAGHVYEHILAITNALGRKLKNGERGHHVDGNEGNNKNSNLVACQDQEYHLLLHMRARALAACGHASFRKCQFCKTYDDTENMKKQTRGNYAHRSCMVEYQRKLKVRKTEGAKNVSKSLNH